MQHAPREHPLGRAPPAPGAARPGDAELAGGAERRGAVRQARALALPARVRPRVPRGGGERERGGDGGAGVVAARAEQRVAGVAGVAGAEHERRAREGVGGLYGAGGAVRRRRAQRRDPEVLYAERAYDGDGGRVGGGQVREGRQRVARGCRVGVAPGGAQGDPGASQGLLLVERRVDEACRHAPGGRTDVDDEKGQRLGGLLDRVTGQRLVALGVGGLAAREPGADLGQGFLAARVGKGPARRDAPDLGGDRVCSR